MFASHYKNVCVANIHNMTLRSNKHISATLLRTGIIRLIERHFVTRGSLARPDHTHRLRVLEEFRKWISTIKTYRSCLGCLQRAPEYKFPCDHMVCQDCCIELGQRKDIDPDLVAFSECPFCKLTCSIRIRIRPSTAGVLCNNKACRCLNLPPNLCSPPGP